MRNCPFCNAEIDSDAKFCVYCMHSLVEKQTIIYASKKKPLWIFGLIGLGFMIIAIALVAFLPPKTEAQSTGPEKSSPLDKAPEESSENSPSVNENPVAKPPESPLPGETPVKNNEDIPSSPNTETPEPSTPNTEMPEPSTPNTETPEPSTPNTETPEPSTPSAPPVTQQVVYSYRLVDAGEEYNAGYVNAGNDIIITGVITPSSNGEYNIPDYIDGKRVLVIASNAFTGSGAKKVVIPATVKTIWGNAFAGCPLTDVYFCGNAIYAAGNAFAGISGNLTMHCSATCSDRNFRYYKNTAPNYGAVYVEWNG